MNLKSSFMLFFLLCPGLESISATSDFLTKTLIAPVLSSIRATRPSHLILLALITRILFGEEYRS